jgi:hypothetical protein
MKTSYLAAFAAIGLLTGPKIALAQDMEAPHASVDARSLAIAREILDLGMPPDTRETVFFGTMEQVMSQLRAAQIKQSTIDDPQVHAIIDRVLNEFKADAQSVLRGYLPQIMEAWAVAYATTFTPQELADIRAFVATPSGQRFFELSPAIASEPNFAAVNQRYIDEIYGLLPALQQEMQEELIEYLSQSEHLSEPS